MAPKPLAVDELLKKRGECAVGIVREEAADFHKFSCGFKRFQCAARTSDRTCQQRQNNWIDTNFMQTQQLI
jgi:hypothetical protein